MRTDIMTDITNFHRKYGLGTAARPQAPSAETVAHRIRMTEEESKELVEALQSGDLVKIARECIDLLMVVLGHIVVYGLPFGNIWRAVHQANMRKVRSTDNTKASKPIKPPGWRSPDHDLKQAVYARQKRVPEPQPTVREDDKPIPHEEPALATTQPPEGEKFTTSATAVTAPQDLVDDPTRNTAALDALEADLNNSK